MTDFPNAAELGFDPDALANAVQFASGLRSSSVRVYRHGQLADKSARDARTERIPQPLASTSKGVLSLLVGRAITMGHFALDDRLGTFLPEADAAHAALTVRQLLNQTSGLKFSWVAEWAGLETDVVAQVLALPFAHEPGTVFEYAQTTLSLLGVIIERTTGLDFQLFAQRELFGKIGISRNHWVWLRDRKGRTITAGGLFLRPDHQALLGELMLRMGRWDGEQLINSDYVAQAVTGTVANPGYGFLFWLNEGNTYKIASVPTPLTIRHPIFPGSPRDTYAFCGMLGQLIVVVPSRDLVIIRNGLPTRFERSDPVKYSSATTSPDLKEIVRRIVASVADIPPCSDPGPDTYDDGRYTVVSPELGWSPVFNRDLLRAALNAQPGRPWLLGGSRSWFLDQTRRSIDAVRQIARAAHALLKGQ